MTTKFSANRARVQPTPHVCNSLPPGVERSTAPPGTWYVVTWYAWATPAPNPQPALWGTATVQLEPPDQGPATAPGAPATANATATITGNRQQGTMTLCIETTGTAPTDPPPGGGGNDVITKQTPLTGNPPPGTTKTWCVPIPPLPPGRAAADVYATVDSTPPGRRARVSVTRA